MTCNRIISASHSFLNARISPKENSGANGKFLPKPPPFPFATSEFKTNEPKFWQILSPKNSFAKTSSALFRHLPEYLEGRTPKKNALSLSKEISPPPNQESKEHFSLVLPREARQWRNDTSVRGSLEPPRAPRVRLVGIRIAFKIHSNFRIADRTLVLDFKNAFKIAENTMPRREAPKPIIAPNFNFEKLRRGRDLNPRSLLQLATFPRWCTRPLCDPSVTNLH